jgi:hypothetical protein
MLRVLVRAVTMLNLVVFLISCNSKHDTLNYNFYYYPQQNIYYDIDHQKFYYSLDGAATWNDLSGSVNGNVALGPRVDIVSEDSIVYLKNEVHRRLYGGQVYNYTIQNAALVTGAPEVSDRKVAKKAPVEKPKTEEKQKKGLGKFIDKIFGKGKKK